MAAFPENHKGVNVMSKLGRRLALAGCLTLATPLAALAADSFTLDKGHTEIRFSWDHVGLSMQSGEFRDFEGTIVFDPADVSKSSVDITIQAASLDTGVAPLDEHMKSADMFDVEAHPTITFKSTGVVRTGAEQGRLTGDLTIKGVTKPVILDVTLNHHGEHPLAPFLEAYAGADYAAFSARGSLLRSEFDVGFATPLTSDRIEIVIETEARQVK